MNPPGCFGLNIPVPPFSFGSLDGEAFRARSGVALGGGPLRSLFAQSESTFFDISALFCSSRFGVSHLVLHFFSFGCG